LKNIVGQTSAKIGTTKQINSYKIRIPILKRNINIVDTPGLFEPSKLGEEREKATIIQASNSDLVLFVLDQDINKYENYLIKELLKIGKKIIIVLNKCDLRSRDENNLIKENIISITSARKNKISVVQTIAVPQKSTYTKSDSLNLIPEVGSLFREIIETLDNNGEELLADNILFRSNKLGIKSKNFVQEQRYLMSNKVINKYMWITGGVILVNPLPAVDFLTTTSVNLQMIMELSKIYEIKITKKDAKDLATSLLSVLAKQGILKGGLAILSPALATSLTKIILSKSIQSVTAGWLIRIVGLSLVEYFKNGQDWGDGGIQEVVDKIYRISKREDIFSINAKGDFGDIVGINTYMPGSSERLPRLEFTLKSQNNDNTNLGYGYSSLNALGVNFSGLEKGDFFTVFDSPLIVGHALTGITTSSGSRVPVGMVTSGDYLGGVFRVEEVTGAGDAVSGLTTVTCSFLPGPTTFGNNQIQVGLAGTSNVDTFWGRYSWGQIYGYQNRGSGNPDEFFVNSMNGNTGLSTASVVSRKKPLT